DPDAPERILAAADGHQWACTLAELRSEAHKTAATVRMVMSRSLAFMADPALAASVLPGPGDGFDIPSFLDRTGTVYLIAEAVSEDAPVAPLFAAMATEIHWIAAQIGQASGRARGQAHAPRHDVATPDMIRQLPAGFALVIRGGCAPVIARLPRAWKNPAYRRARRLGLDRWTAIAEQPVPEEEPEPD